MSGGGLLLLDEPESALDLRYRSRMLGLLQSWVRQGRRAALVALHDPALALNGCDRLVILAEGRVRGVLDPAADPLEEMERQLAAVYGAVSLCRCRGRTGTQPAGAAERTGRARRMTGGEGAGPGVPGPREVNKMKAVTKVIFLDEAGEKFFGEGPCRLLHGVEETGSLRAAALSMGMAYTKALKLVRRAEGVLGFALTPAPPAAGTAGAAA